MTFSDDRRPLAFSDGSTEVSSLVAPNITDAADPAKKNLDEGDKTAKGEGKDEEDDGGDGLRLADEHSASSASTRKQAAALYRGLALGPMVRASTIPLRALALHRGADWCYTEELVDRSLIGLVRVERTLRSGVKVVDFEKPPNLSIGSRKRAINHASNGSLAPAESSGPPVLLRIDPSLEAGRLVCQLGTADPEYALQAALVVHRDVSAIDINMGCPKRFSTLGGMGSALLRDPDRACRIIRKLSSNLDVPVSAKVRLLDTLHSTLDFCRGLVHAGASAIAVHGRTPQDPETRDSRRSDLSEVVRLLTLEFPSLPVCANGDFYTRPEVSDLFAATGASGILLSRPALYDVNLFDAPRPPRLPDGSSVVTEWQLPPVTSAASMDPRGASIRDYLRFAAKYDAHPTNVKYVVGEMLQWRRRTPANRVLELAEPSRMANARPTLAQTVACKTLLDLCQLWGVDVAGSATSPSSSNQPPSPPRLAGEHRYDDSYLLLRDEGGSSTPSSTPPKRPRIETGAPPQPAAAEASAAPEVAQA